MTDRTEHTRIQKIIIASLVSYPETIPACVNLLIQKRVFSYPWQDIYDVIISLWERGEHVDIVTVLDKIKGDKLKEALLDSMPLAQLSGIESYTRLLVEHFIIRSVGEAGKELAYRASRDDTDAFELLELAESKIYRLASHSVRKDFVPLSEAAEQAFRRIVHSAEVGPTGIPTRSEKLNQLLGGGFQDEDLIILAGRPSAGKTAFALECGVNSASRGIPTVFFSAEMSAIQLSMRLLAGMSGVDSHRMRLGIVSTKEIGDIESSKKKLSGMPLFIEDVSGISVGELRARTRKIKLEKGISFAIVDYLQLISGGRKETREQEVSHVSKMLKHTAKELHIPVLCCSQMNRLVESRLDRIPVLSDLRESGAIEQDSDVVIFIHAESNNLLHRNMIVAKQRNGPLDEVKVSFDVKTGRFEDVLI